MFKQGLLLLSLMAPLVAPGVSANAQAVSVQYDYDALGRVCRARYSGGGTIRYEYDANGNRRQVVHEPSGGATTTAACPLAAASAAPASTARPRTNRPPSVPASFDAALCVTMYSGAVGCSPQRVNVLRYAFDWDFQSVTVISAAMQSGPGSVAVSTDGKSITVTPPASAATGTAAQVIFTVSDGAGGTATSYLNITYVNI